MKPKQKNIRVTLPEELSDELFQLVENKPSYVSEQKFFQKLIELGIKVQTGAYHDQELINLQKQIDSLIRSQNANQKLMDRILDGQSDIQDSITNQVSDVDMIVTPTTKRQQQRSE